MEEIVITHEEIQRAKAQYNEMFTDDQIRDALENQEKARLIQRDVLATAEQRGIEKFKLEKFKSPFLDPRGFLWYFLAYYGF